ncbi:MAG: hypothetical protein OHK0039_00910 [Bacteroidia bacterium]
MRSYLELIEAWEAFLRDSPAGTLEDFARWLLARGDSPAPVGQAQALQAYFDQQTDTFGYTSANSEAAYLIWRLSKFIRHDTKALFEHCGLYSQDEFAILAHVDYLGECPKKVAVHDNLIEMSTGIDMIRRLVQRGLLLDRPNPADQRERLIRLSEQGAAVLQAVYAGFGGVQDILVDMDESERQDFVSRLKLLDELHTRRVVPS